MTRPAAGRIGGGRIVLGECDERGRMCLALALWNGRDAFLKERLFGLTNGQGNHGEDVKELYYYLDATPTHSYLKMLYKYPQRVFPYSRLIDESRHTIASKRSLNCLTRASSTTTAISTCSLNMPRPRHGRYFDAGDGEQSRC